eukprot:gnl/TRDRNA2_/TRDRNA2_174721_c0_seq1.p1 gnl/TRDRNA2_/TRDRNA2_174721_c0~~gnl/TRDRNA2_/TRDRNA2_174721_c0_seq1.p1  ORF type:complete len:403 (+),score=22.88 gnl/TRDRNA2_/TRDRNA2_174721_c0_seq1:61-1209(+)
MSEMAVGYIAFLFGCIQLCPALRLENPPMQNMSNSSFVVQHAVHNTVTIIPSWPGKAYELACVAGVSKEQCQVLGGKQHGCYEPERETEEMINSFLHDCPGCLFVEIGCNLGHFSAQAAKLGANVDCYEPTPEYVEAMKVTRRLNNAEGRWNIHNVAVLADDKPETMKMGKKTYRPCDLPLFRPYPWTVSTMSIRRILEGRHVQLLNIDIDSIDGALMNTVVKMIASNETQIDTIAVEAGDTNGPKTWDALKHPIRDSSDSPRHGHLTDYLDLQHKYGYDVYRVNIATGREIFDWTGANINKHMVPAEPSVLPMFSIRHFRKLEKVIASASLEDYRKLFRWGNSFIFTKVQLAQFTTHHGFDLQMAGLGEDQFALNSGNPAR